MSSSFFDQFQQHCSELESMGANMGKHGDKKLKGALMVELLRREITKFLEENNEPFKVSAMNSYIAGSSNEYDLMIVKSDADPYMNLVYQPEEVAAIIESKAAGLRDVDNDTDRIAKAANSAITLNPEISFGYITMGETVDMWTKTCKLLKERVHGKNLPYTVILHKSEWGKICDEGSDKEFETFIKFLIGKTNV